MKRSGQRSRLAAIEAALAPGGTILKILGGVPDPAAAAAPAEPQQLELPLPVPSARVARPVGRMFTKRSPRDHHPARRNRTGGRGCQS